MHLLQDLYLIQLGDVVTTACSCYYPMGIQDLVQELGGTYVGSPLGTMRVPFDSFPHTSYKAGGYGLVGSIGKDTQPSDATVSGPQLHRSLGKFGSALT